ncbi:MAG: redox-regulated ATPase YchF [Anaerolineaceae bacterium]|nr:redox-regulated ATPase YchF [Anaerolineaceae bacterium]
MKLGIIGLPQCGKTTLFSALTHDYNPTGQKVVDGRAQIDTAIVSVPDERIDWLSTHYRLKKISHAKITFQDISGITTDQESFPRSLLTILSQVDGFIHVVRNFHDLNIPHPMQRIDIEEDINILLDEFAIADMLTVDRRLESLKSEWDKGGGRNRSEIEYEQKLFEQLHGALETNYGVGAVHLDKQQQKLVSGFGFLTSKPMLIVLNSDDKSHMENCLINTGKHNNLKTAAISLMSKLEMEIAQLDQSDASFFMKEYSMSEPVLDKIIKNAYKMMSLKSFFTVGNNEVRAWTITGDTNAPQAAGTIHSDMQSGFIRAEVMSFANLKSLGSEASVKAAGKWRLEGKEYIVQDGDIINIRFSPPRNNQN